MKPTHNPIHTLSSSPSSGRSGPRWPVWLATGLGAGYLPLMPGTYGSALGVGVYLGLAALARLSPYPRPFAALATLAIAAASIWIVAAALKNFSVEDPQQIVLDEVAGQTVTLLPLSLGSGSGASSWIPLLLGFLLFRAFDTLKPYPIWKLGHLKGAWGVVADDLGAGVAAAIVLAAVTRLW